MNNFSRLARPRLKPDCPSLHRPRQNEGCELAVGERTTKVFHRRLMCILWWASACGKEDSVFWRTPSALGYRGSVLRPENKVTNAPKAEWIFSGIDWNRAESITISPSLWEWKGRGEDTQDMSEKWIMQDTFNRELGFFGISWLQNWLWLCCLSISESDVMGRKGRKVWFCQILFTKKSPTRREFIQSGLRHLMSKILL